MSFSAEFFVVLIRGGFVLGESEIGVAEEFLRYRLLLDRIDHLGLNASDPLDSGALLGRELNFALDRPRAFHGTVDFVEPVGFRDEGGDLLVCRIRSRQRIDRREYEQCREREKDRLPPLHAALGSRAYAFENSHGVTY